MASNAIATSGENQIVTFRRELEDRASEIQNALPKHISAEKFQRTVTTAVMQNPALLKANRRSLLLACFKAAQDGLLPDGREAALVTFKQRTKNPETGQWVSVDVVQYMPMVYGLRKKILQAANPLDGTALVKALEVNVVYAAEVEKGFFRYEVGTEPPLQHRPMLNLTAEEAADENIVAAYSIATMADGTKSYDLLRRFQIDKIRQVSQTGAVGRKIQFGPDKGKEIEAKGPWVDWFPEMAMKSVVRHHSKTLPMSGDVILDVGRDEAEFESSTSVATLLGSTAEDAPMMIDGGERIDPATGESLGVVDDEPTDQRQQETRQEPKPEPELRKAAEEPKRRGRPPRAATTAAEPVSEPASEPREPSATAPSAAKDEPAPTRIATEDLPSNSLAEGIAAAMDRAENVIDLERVYDGHEDAIDDMDDEDRANVMRSYRQNRSRLGARTTASAQ